MNLEQFLQKYPNVDVTDFMQAAFNIVNAIEEANEEIAEINKRDGIGVKDYNALEELRLKMDSSPDSYMYEDYDNALEELSSKMEGNHTIEELSLKLDSMVIKVTIERT